MKAKPKDILVYIAAGAMLVTAGAYHFRKWDHAKFDVSSAELAGICQTVAGCKSVKLGWGWKRDEWSTHMAVTVVAAKKPKNPEVGEAVGNAVQQLVESKQTWLDAGLKNKKIEVRYE